jgi:hypothetical protein
MPELEGPTIDPDRFRDEDDPYPGHRRADARHLGEGNRMTSRDIACNELVELLTEYLEGALAADEVAAVAEHLRDCELCQTYLDQLRATITALGSLPTPTLSDDTIYAGNAPALEHASTHPCLPQYSQRSHRSSRPLERSASTTSSERSRRGWSNG